LIRERNEWRAVGGGRMQRRRRQTVPAECVGRARSAGGLSASMAGCARA